MTEKPTYRIPTMQEIAGIEWNGMNVASTFSGCGGSSLGYKMAGFRVKWASEFVPAAQETYRANHPGTILDGRDIRTVDPREILDSCGLRPGELDVLDGSPPCASFSTAGSIADGWGKVKQYSDTKQRTDDLFWEFVRILRGVQPRAFVAENVTGLVKGASKGMFLAILSELKQSGYNVGCRVVRAEWLGVPQKRHRTIFIGIRNDLRLEPRYPKPLPYCYTVRDAIPWIARIQTGSFCSEWRSADEPMGTITASDGQRNHRAQVEAETDISRFAIGREWDKMGRPGTQSKRYYLLQRPSLDEPCPTILATTGQTGAAGVCHPTERRKFTIDELKRICGFPDDFIVTGDYRQQWERLGRAVPPPMMMHIAKSVGETLKEASS